MKNFLQKLSGITKNNGIISLAIIISFTILTSQLINATFYAEEVLPRIPNQITMKGWEANAGGGSGTILFTHGRIPGMDCHHYSFPYPGHNFGTLAGESIIGPGWSTSYVCYKD